MNAVASIAVRSVFARERIGDVFEEIKPLLAKHYAEIAHYPDIPLKPDFQRYLQAEWSGKLRIYTARSARELIGYAIYVVQPALHYRESLQAAQDILFLDPAYRRGRIGMRLIEFADRELRQEGVQVVFQHMKAREGLSFGPLLERLGYELVDHVYARRLD